MSRLHVDQIFSADIMRIDKSKPIYDLEDDFELVRDKILDKISLKSIDNPKELCYNISGKDS